MDQEPPAVLRNTRYLAAPLTSPHFTVTPLEEPETPDRTGVASPAEVDSVQHWALAWVSVASWMLLPLEEPELARQHWVAHLGTR